MVLLTYHLTATKQCVGHDLTSLDSKVGHLPVVSQELLVGWDVYERGHVDFENWVAVRFGADDDGVVMKGNHQE